MKQQQIIRAVSAMVILLVITACGGAASTDQTAGNGVGAGASQNQEPVVIRWSIGPKGGLGEGAAFVTQYSWVPKNIEVPVNQPFIIRVAPRDNSTTDTIVLSQSLEEAVGMELPDLVVENGQPAETPVMVIESANKTFDVFSREHRGVGGFGSIVTAGG
jgi:hypothetical protein